jgi:hypothetical protein
MALPSDGELIEVRRRATQWPSPKTAAPQGLRFFTFGKATPQIGTTNNPSTPRENHEFSKKNRFL